jgi:FixJ family two-component response regulator
MANSTIRRWSPYATHMTEASHWIAIVDDDPSVLKGLARLLRARGFDTKTYRSARDFLATLPDGLPQFLIVDLQMPGMSGLELQRHLIREGIKIPTIVITAHYEAGAREPCESAGVAAFLSKPLQDARLLAAIDDARVYPKT